MKLAIEIPHNLYESVIKGYALSDLGNSELYKAVQHGIPLPEHHGRLIDADKTLAIAWHKFWKQEEEHEKTIEGYDILRDRLYEQEGFECCQQTIVNAETIIPATDKTATWKRIGSDVHGLIDMYECSNCGANPPKKQIGVSWGWDFVDCCPNCGAKIIPATKEGAE